VRPVAVKLLGYMTRQNRKVRLYRIVQSADALMGCIKTPPADTLHLYGCSQKNTVYFDYF
jgi:hypothetical protein